MLICPQCQFENPNTNKFCQRCGTSLTHKVCPACGTTVDLDELQCHNCGAETGTLWWAIIMREPETQPLTATESKAPEMDQQEGIAPLPASLDQNGTQMLEAENGSEAEEVGEEEQDLQKDSHSEQSLPESPAPLYPDAGPPTSPALATAVYLDPQQRYQLLESLSPLQEIAPGTEVQVKVLDCEPFQLSPLAALVGNTRTWPAAPPAGTQPLAVDAADWGMAMAIPAIARAYLSLHSQFYETIPTIHDVWQHDGFQVTLIEDRSDWQKLLDLWHGDQSTSLQQILHWFHRMAQLWTALEPWDCRQSLLVPANLRVDEDQALALQRLYVEPETGELLTIKDLGRVWQRLFQESQRTQFGSLVQLLHELQAGNILTVDDLCLRLEAIAAEMQVGVNSPSLPASLPAPKSDVEKEEVTVNPAPTAAPTVLQLDEPEEGATKGDDVPTIVLPMQLISLEDAGRTDVGRQRHHNEDFFAIETAISKLEFPKGRAVQARGLYVLCDGMGGHAGGEVASTLAVKTLRQYFQTHWTGQQLPPEQVIREAVRLANQAIYDVNQNDARSGVGRMGTTMVLVLIQNTEVALAHVGDSRLYRLSRKRGLEQLTVDHEVGQREIIRGVEPAIAYARADAFQLTQALGPRDENFINPDVQFLELNEDTLLVLASDGLSDNDLLEHHWRTHLEPLLSSRSSLERGVSDLVELANQYNGHDNITAVVIRAKVRPNLEQQLQ